MYFFCSYTFWIVLFLAYYIIDRTVLTTWRFLAFYRKQGLFIVPGADRPFVGNLKETKEFRKLAAKEQKIGLYTYLAQECATEKRL